MFALDEFKRYFSGVNRYKDGIRVCNSEKSDQVGRHWLLIFIRILLTVLLNILNFIL